MKRLYSFLCFLSTLFVCGTLSYALVIPASEDGSSAVNKLTNAGNRSVVLSVDATHKAYVFFDLSEIPTTAAVRWAKLRLFLPAVRVKGGGVKVHTITGVWNEAAESAEPSISSTPVGTIGPDKLSTKRFVTVDVTSTVQDWINGKTPNGGFAFVAIPNANPALVSAIHFASKEGIIAGLPAELDIEFQPEGLDQLKNSLNPLLSSGTFALNNVSQLPPALLSFLAPSITTQPSVPTVGGSLAVRAQGLGALSYQWMQNGVPVEGGTSALLSTVGLKNGTYWVSVTNGFSSVTSAEVQILDLVTVLGGTLPSESSLAGQAVSDFQIGKTEVTWGNWKTVRDWAVANGYSDLANIGAGSGDNYPVTNVSWYDVVKWCNARSEMEGKTPVYQVSGKTFKIGSTEPTVIAAANGYRLPTEAEWEWAARGGKQTKGYTYSGGNILDEVGWYIGDASYSVHEVGKKLANELGIHDMSGNLWEWCGSWYPGYEGSYRVIRGACWYEFSGYRTVARRCTNPESRDGYGGFRLAISSVP